MNRRFSMFLLWVLGDHLPIIFVCEERAALIIYTVLLELRSTDRELHLLATLGPIFDEVALFYSKG